MGWRGFPGGGNHPQIFCTPLHCGCPLCPLCLCSTATPTVHLTLSTPCPPFALSPPTAFHPSHSALPSPLTPAHTLYPAHFIQPDPAPSLMPHPRHSLAVHPTPTLCSQPDWPSGYSSATNHFESIHSNCSTHSCSDHGLIQPFSLTR